MRNQTSHNAPKADELEISFFGPSYGECIVIHLGDGQWIIVDSCLSPSTGKPQALDYLDAIGADHSRIRAIVATHWDDDHIGGLSQCLHAAPNAKLILSGAFFCEEFTTLLRLYANNTLRGASGSDLNK